MRSLHDIPSFTMQVEYNNVRIQDEFIYGMISNSTSVGGFKGMTGKDVLLDDGVFEVTLIKKPRNPIELNEIIASLINLVDDTDMIYSFKSDEVEFMAREEVPWTLDGEFGGAHEEVIVKISAVLSILWFRQTNEKDCYKFNFIFERSNI